MIESETIKTVKLNKIFRQKKNSGIAENAHKINKGEFPSLNDANMRFYFIDKENAESIKEEIGKLVSVKLPNYYKIDSIEDIQVLTPMKNFIKFRDENQFLRGVSRICECARPEQVAHNRSRHTI